MKRLSIGILLLCMSVALNAQMPQELLFQGKLRVSAGSPVKDGTYTITFRLYDAATGGTKLWEETQDVSVTGGNFVVELGKTTPLSVAFDKPYWLEMQVSGDTPMTPRKPFKPAPYAFRSKKASDADTVDSFHASSTPKPNNLLPLDSSGKLPVTVLPSLSGTFVEKSPSAAQTIFTSGDFTGLILKGQGIFDTTNHIFTGQTTPWFEIQDKNGLSMFQFSPGTPGLYCPQGCVFEGLSEITTGDLSIQLGGGTANGTLSLFNANPALKANLNVQGGVTAQKFIGDGSGLTNLPPQPVGPNTVGSPEIIDNSITSADIDSVSVQTRVTGTCPSGQYVQSVNADGTVMCGVDAGGGPDSVTTTEIQDNTITDIDIAAGANIAQSKVLNLTTDLSSKINFAPAAPQVDVSTNPSIFVNKTGGGNLLQLQQGGVDKFVVDSTGTITTGAVSNADTVDTFHASTTPTAGTILPLNGSALFPASVLPPITTTEIQDNTITDIDIAAGANIAQSKVLNLTTDLSSKINFAPAAPQGDVSTNPSIFVNDTGGGNLLQLQQGGVDQFIVDNTGNLDFAGDIIKTASAKIQLNNAANTTLNITNMGAGTASLQVEGATVMTSANGVLTNPATNQLIQGTGGTIIPLIIQGQTGQTVPIFSVKDSGGVDKLSVMSDGHVYIPSTNQLHVLTLNNDSPSGPMGDMNIDVLNNVGNSKLIVQNSDPSFTGGILVEGNVDFGGILMRNQPGITEFQLNDPGNTTLNITNTGGGTASLQVEGATVLTSVNGVITNPATAQTIQPTVDVTPLVLKDDAVGTTTDLLDVQDNAGTSLVKVNPSGNFLVGNPVFTSAKISVEEAGTANYAGYFKINNASNPYPALSATTNGSGSAIYGDTTGIGNAIYGYTTGAGRAGYFGINNVSNSFPAVEGNTTGTGPAISGYNTGTGRAGFFLINNVSNSSSLIAGDILNGTGNLLQLQQNSVDKFVVDNAGNLLHPGPTMQIDLNDPASSILNITNTNTGTASLQVEGATVLTSVNGVITNPATVQTIQPTADVTPLVLKDDTVGNATDLLDVQDNAGTSLVKVNPSGSLLVGNPATTTPKISVEETGTGDAGYFWINNAANTASAVNAITNGTGGAVYGYTTGTAGNAGTFEVGNAGNASTPLLVNTMGTGNLLQLQQSAVDKFIVGNTGNLQIVNPGTTTFDLNDAANTVLNITNTNAGGTASLQVEGATVLTSVNGVITNPSTVQTIQPTADVTPLVLKDDTVGNATDLLDVQDNAGTSLVKVSPTGNLLIGSPVAPARISIEEASTQLPLLVEIGNAGSIVPLIKGNNTGTGGLLQLQTNSVDKFVVDNTGNTLIGNPSLTTAKVSVEETGTGNYGGYISINNVANPNSGLYITTNGTGDALSTLMTGTASAGSFQINNAANSASALSSLIVSGTGDALSVTNQSTGMAGNFQITNIGSAATLLYGNHVGSGSLLQLQAGGVDAFVVGNAGNLTLNGNILAFNGVNAVPVTGNATQQLIQSGNACEAAPADGFITVTFPVAFAATPILTIRQTGGTSASPIFAPTATIFTIPSLEASVSTECFDWIAIGQK